MQVKFHFFKLQRDPFLNSLQNWKWGSHCLSQTKRPWILGLWGLRASWGRQLVDGLDTKWVSHCNWSYWRGWMAKGSPEQVRSYSHQSSMATTWGTQLSGQGWRRGLWNAALPAGQGRAGSAMPWSSWLQRLRPHTQKDSAHSMRECNLLYRMYNQLCWIICSIKAV